MKKFLVCMLFIAFLVQMCPAAFTTSITSESTYKNAYRWTGRPGADKILDWAEEVEASINGTTAVPFSTYTPTDTEPGTTAGMLYYDLSENKFKYYNGGGWVAIESGSSGNSLGAAYTQGSTITVNSGTVAMTATDGADVVVLTLAQSDTGTTKGVVITNAGTGNTIDIEGQASSNDIEGTGDVWGVTSAGVGTFVGLTSSTGDVTLTGANYNIIHDASADQLEFKDSALLTFGTSDDITFSFDGAGSDLNILGTGLEVAFGVNDEGIDVVLHGETAGANITWDESADQLVGIGGAQVTLNDSVELLFGTGASNAGDFSLVGTSAPLLTLNNIVDGSGTFAFGAADTGLDVAFYGDAGTGDMIWDENQNTNGALVFDNSDIELGDADFIQFGDDADFQIHSTTAKKLQYTPAGATDDYEVLLGVDESGVDIKAFGATTGEYMLWDASEDTFSVLGGNVSWVLSDGEADQVKFDAQGTVADASGHAINFETSNAGILLNADGAANGDVELDAADDIKILSGGAVTITNTDALTISGGATITGTTTIATALVTPVEVVAATNEIEITESGTVYVLNSGTEFATTLPTVATSAGVTYRFIIGAAPAGQSYTIVTDSSENFIYGATVEAETDTGDDGPTIQAGDTITFVNGVSVIGDWVELTSDGVNWYVSGMAAADGGITLAQAS